MVSTRRIWSRGHSGDATTRPASSPSAGSITAPTTAGNSTWSPTSSPEAARRSATPWLTSGSSARYGGSAGAATLDDAACAEGWPPALRIRRAARAGNDAPRTLWMDVTPRVYADNGSPLNLMASPVAGPPAPRMELLDAKGAAALLNVPATWVLAEARADRIPHVRLGRYVRFDAAELQTWAVGRRRGPWGAGAPECERVATAGLRSHRAA